MPALVWTLHHFLLPKCPVLAAGRFDDPAVLREALARMFEAEIRKRQTLAELPGDDFYREWMRLAVNPAHVEQVSAHFDSAELEARRRYNQGRAQPKPSGADGAGP